MNSSVLSLTEHLATHLTTENRRQVEKRRAERGSREVREKV